MDPNVLIGVGSLVLTIIGCTWALGSRLTRIEVAIEHLNGKIDAKPSDSDLRRAIRAHVKEKHDNRTPAYGVDIPRL